MREGSNIRYVKVEGPRFVQQAEDIREKSSDRVVRLMSAPSLALMVVSSLSSFQYCLMLPLISNYAHDKVARKYGMKNSVIIQNGYNSELFYYDNFRSKHNKEKFEVLSVGNLESIGSQISSSEFLPGNFMANST